ncbi:MAG: SDR family NAD(P)-dependent oxidoreductase [Verrucomicrobiales bacterium]|nr:SDR family oxidoreductase [Verrucomicrobiota bacterium JB025]
MNEVYRDKVVVLTGAASGIGRALAERLAASGATVYALDADGGKLDGLGAGLELEGQLIPRVLDVRDLAAYRDLVADVVAKSGRIDYLFNNAGVTLLGPAESIPFERWKWLLDINLMGVVHGIECVYPVMIGQGSGHIINTASLAGSTAYATAAAYTASKAAVLELTRSLRAEARAYGVRVSVGCPGYVDSGIFSQDRIVGAERAKVMNDLPLKPMTPDEAAGHFARGVAKGKATIVFPFSARVLWVASKWAPWVNGIFQNGFMKAFDKP